jgi:hypothetical protein
VGLLDGWPFPVKEDPTQVQPTAASPSAANLLETLRQVFD